MGRENEGVNGKGAGGTHSAADGSHLFVARLPLVRWGYGVADLPQQIPRTTRVGTQHRIVGPRLRHHVRQRVWARDRLRSRVPNGRTRGPGVERGAIADKRKEAMPRGVGIWRRMAAPRIVVRHLEAVVFVVGRRKIQQIAGRPRPPDIAHTRGRRAPVGIHFICARL